MKISPGRWSAAIMDISGLLTCCFSCKKEQIRDCEATRWGYDDKNCAPWSWKVPRKNSRIINYKIMFSTGSLKAWKQGITKYIYVNSIRYDEVSHSKTLSLQVQAHSSRPVVIDCNYLFQYHYVWWWRKSQRKNLRRNKVSECIILSLVIGFSSSLRVLRSRA